MGTVPAGTRRCPRGQPPDHQFNRKRPLRPKPAAGVQNRPAFQIKHRGHLPCRQIARRKGFLPERALLLCLGHENRADPLLDLARDGWRGEHGARPGQHARRRGARGEGHFRRRGRPEGRLRVRARPADGARLPAQPHRARDPREGPDGPGGSTSIARC